jgi:hypothetical protein
VNLRKVADALSKYRMAVLEAMANIAAQTGEDDEQPVLDTFLSMADQKQLEKQYPNLHGRFDDLEEAASELIEAFEKFNSEAVTCEDLAKGYRAIERAQGGESDSIFAGRSFPDQDEEHEDEGNRVGGED